MTDFAITEHMLQAICTTEAGKQRCLAFVVPLNTQMQRYGMSTPARAACFLAQILHESAEFHYLAEIADGHTYNQRADLGNTRPEAIAAARRHGTTPGAFYKGHGCIQITGYDEHLVCSEALFGDARLVENPLILTQTNWAVASACWFWSAHHLNDAADKGDFLHITRVINGGENGQADRLMYLARARSALAASAT